MQAEQQDEHEDEESTKDNVSVTSSRSSRVSWIGLLFATKESLYNDNQEMGSRLKNWITLDNGSTLSLFSNPDLVEDIHKSSKTLVLATNAGVKHSNQEALVPGFGKVYFDKDTMFSDLKK